MQPGQYDFEVEGGDCLPLIAHLKDGNDNDVDLTGFTTQMEITWHGDSLTLTDADFDLNFSPISGIIQGELSGAQTNVLPFGRMTRYEWSITDFDGCKMTFLKGYIVRT